jgi:hypothetical protein
MDQSKIAVDASFRENPVPLSAVAVLGTPALRALQLLACGTLALVFGWRKRILHLIAVVTGAARDSFAIGPSDN